MGFETLLGNEQLKQNLRGALAKGRVSHFYLISGPEGSGKHTLARLLAAAMVCKSADRPCGSCPACRKALANNHPDIITVDDPERKTVPVNLIRDTIADMYIRPNEADKKIYLLPRGQDMEIPSQNALLKILEEPPAYGVFLLLTTKAEKMLPTVRSRCTELQLRPVAEQTLLPWLTQKFPDAPRQTLLAAITRSGGYPGQAAALVEAGADIAPQTAEFLQAFSVHSNFGLLKVLAALEKTPRDQVIALLEQWAACLEGALVHRIGGNAVTPQAQQLSAAVQPRELMQAIADLQKAIEYLQCNVSAAAVCGWLTHALQQK